MPDDAGVTVNQYASTLPGEGGATQTPQAPANPYGNPYGGPAGSPGGPPPGGPARPGGGRR
jgi:hypothetical protein